MILNVTTVFQITKARLLEEVPVFLKSVISTLASANVTDLPQIQTESEPEPEPLDNLVPSVWKERVTA